MNTICAGEPAHCGYRVAGATLPPDILHCLHDTEWSVHASAHAPNGGIEEIIENGRVAHLPGLEFSLTPDETDIVARGAVRAAAKNISMRWSPASSKGQLRGAEGSRQDILVIGAMIERFSQQAQALIQRLLPSYAGRLQRGNASFRPTQIGARVTSWRHDDSRLHTDAFPSNPLGGLRLLRVFSNVDPRGMPRVWRLGEPFPHLVDRYRHRLKRPWPASAWVLHNLGITKRRRTLYDHAMLQLHDLAKADTLFQRESPQRTVAFDRGTSWIVFSDQVLHAAVSGRNLLEHTFFLDPSHQKNPYSSPREILRQKLDWWNAERPPPDRGHGQPWWSPAGNTRHMLHDDH